MPLPLPSLSPFSVWHVTVLPSAGLSELVELLESEYAIIQELALKTLVSCMHDGEGVECGWAVGGLWGWGLRGCRGMCVHSSSSSHTHSPHSP